MRPIPDEIYDLARRTHERISEPDFVIPGPVLQGTGVSIDEYKTRIAGRLTELGDALGQIRDRRKQFELTLEEKLGSITEFDRVYTFVAVWARGMFLAGGEPGLARRIRPRIPRPANPAEDDEVVEVDEPGLQPAEDDSDEAQSSAPPDNPNNSNDKP